MCTRWCIHRKADCWPTGRARRSLAIVVSNREHEVIVDSVAFGGVEIRHVRTHEEFARCVELQEATWGAGFRESVPATILKITQRLGGVTAGAFAPDGTLLGFVFGVTGIEHGELVHWSDMLAVSPRVQNLGIGRRLKEFQRDTVRALGATRMYWTFDPLVARNAYFNLNRLGARAVEYVQDMYGADTGSILHSGLGTDRFVVVWPIAPAARATRRSLRGTGARGRSSAPVLNAGADGDASAELESLVHSPPALARVAIPANIFQLQQDRIADAAHWRRSTRRALQWALANGYEIARFERDPPAPAATTCSSAPPASRPPYPEPMSDTPHTLQLQRITLREIRLPLREPFRISSGVVHRAAHPPARAHRRRAAPWRGPSASPARSPTTAPRRSTPRGTRSASGSRRACSAGASTGPRGRARVLERDIARPQHGQGGGRDGLLGARGRARGRARSSRLLGGTRDRVPTGISLGIQATPEALVARARARARRRLPQDQGEDPARRRRRVRARGARGAGREVTLMADANNAYTLDDADHLARLDAFDLMMIEQPLGRDDLVPPRRAAAAAEDARSASTSRSPTSTARGHDRARRGRIVNIKPGRVGGFAVVDRASTTSACDTAFPSGAAGCWRAAIGRAYNVALASLPELHAARRPLAERALLGARHRDARVDDGPRRDGARPARPAGDRRGAGRRPHRRRSRCGASCSPRGRGAAR